MDFQDSVVVTLHNDISIVGTVRYEKGFCFVKQSEKSGVVGVAPYSSIKTIYNLQGKSVEIVSEQEKEQLLITEEERLVRIKGGITFTGNLVKSSWLEQLLPNGIILCVNQRVTLFYYIPDEEVL